MSVHEPESKEHNQSLHCRPWLQQSPTWRGCADPKSFEAEHPLCAEAERLQLKAGVVAYHHFFGDHLAASQRSIFYEIHHGRFLVGKPRCQSVEQITAALQDPENDAPHYGDGVYSTVHSNVRSACSAVKRAHGMAQDRTHRVVLSIRDTSSFRKYDWTGGVTRYLAEDREYSTEENMVLVDGVDAEFVRIEVWRDDRWHELPSIEQED